MGNAKSVFKTSKFIMKILFISGLYPKGSELYYNMNIKQGSLQTPANVYQWGIVKGLISNKIDTTVYSFPFLPTYPFGYRKISTRKENIIYNQKEIGLSFSYNTIAGLKELNIVHIAKRNISIWCENISNEEKGVILIYSVYGPFLKAAIEVSNKYKNIIVCPIVTDLFISSLEVLKKYSLPKKIQGYFEYKRIKFGLNKANTFVLLAKGMEDFIPKAINNHFILEGIAEDTYPNIVPKKERKEKILLYTGSLGIHTSIKELVDAFIQTTDKSFQLIICGTGYFEKYIKGKAEIDKRIIYKGNIPRDEAVNLQRESTLLINPRLPSIPDTPYSFPSKTIEYLVSGTPMIGYKLKGITEDYYKHFYIPKDETTKSLTDLITETLHKPQNELNTKANIARQYIIENKNAKKQVERLINYLNNFPTKEITRKP